MNPVYVGTLAWGVKGQYHLRMNLAAVRVEEAFQPVVDRDTFDRVQVILKSRAPDVVPPRSVSNSYFLSGLLRCGGCHDSMFGAGAESGRFHYYVCSTAQRMGRQVCHMKPIPQAVIEDKVTEKVRDVILQDSHMEELVRLTNEELSAAVFQMNEQTRGLDSQLKDVERRLGRLYDALESGKLALEDLAPRITELREKLDLLQRTKVEAQQTIDGGDAELVDRDLVLSYVTDLKGVLNYGSVVERRAFLRSFIQSVERDEGRVTVRYTLPLPQGRVSNDPLRVLDLVPSGGAEGTRTPDPLRAKLMPYRLRQSLRICRRKHGIPVPCPSVSRFLPRLVQKLVQ